nr:MAG TPA: hypothetical protein [Caudoviricetes sp.]
MFKSRTYSSHHRIPFYEINMIRRRWRDWLNIVAKFYSIK